MLQTPNKQTPTFIKTPNKKNPKKVTYIKPLTLHRRERNEILISIIEGKKNFKIFSNFLAFNGTLCYYKTKNIKGEFKVKN